MPTSYNHLTEIDEQNNEEEDRSALVKAEKLENQDENLKLVLPIL